MCHILLLLPQKQTLLVEQSRAVTGTGGNRKPTEAASEKQLARPIISSGVTRRDATYCGANALKPRRFALAQSRWPRRGPRKSLLARTLLGRRM
jgi:hypothetical protein